MEFTKDPSTHPANGPLTEERLIRVREWLQSSLLYSEGSNRDYMMADAAKAIDELLALRKVEQEPVYQVRHGDQWRDLNKAQYDDHVNLGAEGLRTLYAAPQLPQPAVVDERAAFNAWNNEDNLPIAGVGAKNAAWLAWQARATLCGNSVLDVPPERPADSSSGDDVEAWFDEGWNACRAAMLQGAEPVQGWIPCSERMPPCFTGVIVAAPWPSAPDGYAMKWATSCPWHPEADENGWLIPGASWKPTHWMPLPAAPQQEV